MPTPSSHELVTQARRIHGKLQTDPAFEHFGADSRGVVIAPPPMKELELLKQQIQQSAEGASGLAFAGVIDLLRFATRQGMYVRTKGNEHYLSVDVRGVMPEFDESTSHSEVAVALARRSGVELQFEYERPVTLEVHADAVQTLDGGEVEGPLNELLKLVPADQRLSFTGGMLDLLEAKINAMTGA